MEQLKVLSIFGTRPEAIKMAPVVKALEEEGKINSMVVVTAQHREMLDQVLDLFTIRPDYDLDIMQPEQSLTDITVNILRGLEEIIRVETPDLVLVHGDTTTTFIASLAAFYQQVQVGHIEAGLRSYNKYAPYPEEINRKLTGGLADFHFAPTSRARENLLREGVKDKQIFVTGNTVIDALFMAVDPTYQFKLPVLKQIDFRNKKVILLTVHRRENLGAPLENIFKAIKDIVTDYQDVEVVFPVHLNPKLRRVVNSKLIEIDRVNLLEPLGYQEFVNLLARSYLIVTDSGGIQEEAPSLGKPVLVTRNTTERKEGMVAGTVKLVGTDYQQIYQELQELLDNKVSYQEATGAINPYGDGQASKRIVQAILYLAGEQAILPEDFLIKELVLS